MDKATVARFWGKVQVGAAAECWLWKPLGSLNGYGQFTGGGKTRLAHRVAYELSKEPIPKGLTIDHLCRVRNCVNPAHLEVVTRAENLRRAKSWENGASFQRSKTHCSNGHPYSGENLRICKNGKRACRTCARAYSAKSRAQNRQEDPPAPRVLKEFCVNGHAFTEHGYVSGGQRCCRVCVRERLRRSRAKAKAAMPPKVPETHCKHGHEWNEINTYISPRGQRACRACHRDKSREWHRVRAAERQANLAA